MRRRELLVATKDTTGEFVDLGLSVKWASGNIVKDGTKYSIGAPTSQGCYFSWGNVEGHNDGEGYDFSSSVYNSTPGKSLTANISPTGGYDAARATLGGNWRMPTNDECQELIDNCTWAWTTVDGVNGYRVTSKKSGYTNNSIFIPCAGCYMETDLYGEEYYGHYLSTACISSVTFWHLYFDGNPPIINNYNRYCGYTVRAVQ
jgi:hypothetical protein